MNMIESPSLVLFQIPSLRVSGKARAFHGPPYMSLKAKFSSALYATHGFQMVHGYLNDRGQQKNAIDLIGFPVSERFTCKFQLLFLAYLMIQVAGVQIDFCTPAAFFD